MPSPYRPRPPRPVRFEVEHDIPGRGIGRVVECTCISDVQAVVRDALKDGSAEVRVTHLGRMAAERSRLTARELVDLQGRG